MTTPSSFGVLKQNGYVKTGESAITLGLDFWTVVTTIVLPTAATASTTVGYTTSTTVAGYTGESEAVEFTAQQNLDKLIEIIALNGQPVILYTPTYSSPNYTLTFAIEHNGSWGTDSTALVAAIAAHGKDYGFNSATTTATVVSL